MGNNTNDRPQRPEPNESENQPGFEPEDERQSGEQRQSQGGRGPDERKGAFDPQHKDDVASPPIGGGDPKIAR